MAEADVVGACAAVIAIRLKNRRRKRRERSMWVIKWLLSRGAHGAYEHYLQELDVSSYRNFDGWTLPHLRNSLHILSAVMLKYICTIIGGRGGST